MTTEQKKTVLEYDIIFKKILNKNIPNNKFKEDILQDLYFKIFNCNTLPIDKIEILKFCKTTLKNLIIDSKRYNKYKLISQTNEIFGIDRDEDDITVYSYQEQIVNFQILEEQESFFTNNLNDCLLQSYFLMNGFEKVLLIEYFLLGFTAKDLANKYNILRQTVKNTVRKFRQSCEININ